MRGELVETALHYLNNHKSMETRVFDKLQRGTYISKPDKYSIGMQIPRTIAYPNNSHEHTAI